MTPGLERLARACDPLRTHGMVREGDWAGLRRQAGQTPAPKPRTRLVLYALALLRPRRPGGRP